MPLTSLQVDRATSDLKSTNVRLKDTLQKVNAIIREQENLYSLAELLPFPHFSFVCIFNFISAEV